MQNHVTQRSDLSSFSAHHEHVQSHLYTLHHAVNDLVAAASPLISLVNRLTPQQQSRPPKTWQAVCGHELSAFRQHSQRAGFDQNTIGMAQWLLCQWIHQVTQWPLAQDQDTPHFLRDTPPTDNPVEQAIQTLFQQPHNATETLELVYILVRLGLIIHHDRAQSEHHTQQMYYFIQQQQATHQKARQRQTQQKQLTASHHSRRQAIRQQLQFNTVAIMVCLMHALCLGQWIVIGLQSIFAQHVWGTL